MAIANIESFKQILLPTKRSNPKGTSYTSTYNPSSTGTTLSLPQYRDHLTDLFTSRQSSDSRTLMKDLVKFDPDVSAALHAYLTVANTTPRFYVYNMDGELDREGQKTVEALLSGLTRRQDYTTGFAFTKSLRELAEDFRYMMLMRGGVATELVFNKLLQPVELRQVDVVTLEWFETAPGVYKPQQRPPGASEPLKLDIANFFVKTYRQNPTEIYPQSIFVSAINTIAARQQVINDLYRIMQKTGYPRIEITVMEEVLRKNAPASAQASQTEMNNWMTARITEVSAQLNGMRPDSVFVHTDSVQSKILNEKGPSSSMNVTDVINVLNSQNQAALKTMATIIGRGESGVNTASVEARVFSLSADSLNGPIADLFSDILTFAARMLGYEGYVECYFDKVELRPDTELEPQLTMRQARLLENLSLGMITDDEYHIEIFNRLRPDSAPELSGTGFMAAAGGSKTGVDSSKVSPNSDPLGRSLSAPGSKSARSATVKKSN